MLYLRAVGANGSNTRESSSSTMQLSGYGCIPVEPVPSCPLFTGVRLPRQSKTIGWGVFHVCHRLHGFPQRPVWRGPVRFAGAAPDRLLFALAKRFSPPSFGSVLSGSKAMADGLNPLTASQMSSDGPPAVYGKAMNVHNEYLFSSPIRENRKHANLGTPTYVENETSLGRSSCLPLHPVEVRRPRQAPPKAGGDHVLARLEVVVDVRVGDRDTGRGGVAVLLDVDNYSVSG